MKYKFFQSPIHGLGCQAIEDIKKNEIMKEEMPIAEDVILWVEIYTLELYDKFILINL